MDLQALLNELLVSERTHAILRAAIVLLLGLVAAQLVNRRLSLRRVKALPQAQIFLIRRVASWTIVAITFAWAMRELGFEITTLLGAAGILTLAVAFAAQTSVSNLISGLFLMGERPFGVGDIVQIQDTTGEVLSIDLLSVRLRTFDNLMVRIPNETMLKSNVTTLTAFPIRRLDVKVGVAYKEDLARVRRILEQVADESPICLEEPKPLFIFLGFGDSSLDIQFSVWAKRENFLDLRNAIYADIKGAFDRAGIEIPFPHRSLYAGSVTDPLPIRVVTDAD
jgi:small-conductance mechanosensitive channel